MNNSFAIYNIFNIIDSLNFTENMSSLYLDVFKNKKFRLWCPFTKTSHYYKYNCNSEMRQKFLYNKERQHLVDCCSLLY